MDPSVRCEHTGIADEHIEACEPLDRPGHHGLDLVEVTHVGQHGLDRAVFPARPATVASREGALTSLTIRSVAGSLPSCRAMAETERPARTDDRHHPSRRCHTNKYPPSTLSTVPVM